MFIKLVLNTEVLKYRLWKKIKKKSHVVHVSDPFHGDHIF
jgi:hypothetical protein